MRVLIVEADRKTASFISKALLTEGLAVEAVTNGEDALALAAVTPFDAIVLDIMLPGRDGLNVLRLLRVRGDRHRLRQLLLNLADNAVKYCQPGGEVHFTLQREGGFAELVVTNTGPGLAGKLQPRVFERFFRGDARHNHDQESCGLGLSIAQWIIRAHGGEIHFHSQTNVATRVTVRLPLANND